MTNYICIKCNREFKRKSHLDNHMNKKIPCVNKNNDRENINSSCNIPKKLGNPNREIINSPCNLPKKLGNDNREKTKNPKKLAFIDDLSIINEISDLTNKINDNQINNNIDSKQCPYCQKEFQRNYNILRQHSQ